MQYITLTIALFALLVAVLDLCFNFARREENVERLASLALKVAELEKAQGNAENYPDMSKRWEDGLNNMMEYSLKGYGLNTDFLKKDGDADG